ncbi:unnamed protein product [Fusarium equiseti]|uniref:Uncharacterized protein n=1 Tax=Fusarium equiseti TaxID=61235 RepID=A0A8J2IDG7_FUSEQ|nr:unnamed protein product [Fusarium equiseti]
MDPFHGLPTLVLDGVFFQLRDTTSISQLIKASPSMLSHWVQYGKGITHHIVTDILSMDDSGCLLDDALRILDIQNAQLAREYYSQVEFMEPRKVVRPNYLWPLFFLLSRLISFIVDFVFKAASPYLPRAYLGIPDSLGRGSYFKGRDLGNPRIEFSTLTASEQYRFLRAFLRYELICRIYHPAAWTMYEKQGMYVNIMSGIGVHGAMDPGMLNTVHEYYEGLYGSVFAHCLDAWVPGQSLKDMLSFDYGLLFPDTIFLDAKEYLRDLGIYHTEIVRMLPCFGISFLTTMIRGLNQGGDHAQHVRKLLHSLVRTRPCAYYPWIDEQHLGETYIRYPAYDRLLRGQNAYLHRADRLSNAEIALYQGGKSDLPAPRWLELHSLQLRIYRQRAWGLLDDDRLYPGRERQLPTLDELSDLENGLGEDGQTDWGLERSRRRSQKWHDYDTYGDLIERPAEPWNESDDDADTLIGDFDQMEGMIDGSHMDERLGLQSTCPVYKQTRDGSVNLGKMLLPFRLAASYDLSSAPSTRSSTPPPPYASSAPLTPVLV